VERLTKSLVLVSLLGNLLLQVRFTSGWPELPILTLMAFVGSWLLARVKGPWAGAAVPLALTAVVPAVFKLLTGFFHFTYLVIWMAAFVGVVLASRRAWRWSMPAPYRMPLVLWALTLAAAWPIVILREVDFTLAVLNTDHVMNTSAGEYPTFLMRWILSVASSYLLGIVWLDWMAAEYGTAPPERLERELLVPLAIGVVLSSVIGIYQIAWDITFLSGGIWPRLHRAAGGMFDANPFGMLCAMWVPVPVALAYRSRREWFLPIANAAMILCWAGVWASGSRTALGAALIGTFALCWEIGTSRSLSLRRIRGPITAAAAVAFTGFLGLVVAAWGWEGGPLRKILPMVPGATPSAVVSLVQELWDRSIYGPAAVRMFSEFPLAGVGVGSYHYLVTDYMSLMINTHYYADNAQNWYRHQLAEFGLLGSVGWIAWVVVFGMALVRPAARPEYRFKANLVRASLLAFGLMSLLGMPAQSPPVGLMFCVFAFWYLRLIASGTLSEPHTTRAMWSGAIWLTVAAFAGVSVAYARGPLRVPARAVMFTFDHDYQYGLSRDTEDPSLFWTREHAVIVPRAPEKLLRLTVWVDHPDANQRQVNAQVWVDGKRVMNYTALPRGVKVVEDVAVAGSLKRFVLEARVNRTYRPDGCAEEKCARGLAIRWAFVNSPGP
jgi:hypothetical protein